MSSFLIQFQSQSVSQSEEVRLNGGGVGGVFGEFESVQFPERDEAGPDRSGWVVAERGQFGVEIGDDVKGPPRGDDHGEGHDGGRVLVERVTLDGDVEEKEGEFEQIELGVLVAV